MVSHIRRDLLHQTLRKADTQLTSPDSSRRDNTTTSLDLSSLVASARLLPSRPASLRSTSSPTTRHSTYRLELTGPAYSTPSRPFVPVRVNSHFSDYAHRSEPRAILLDSPPTDQVESAPSRQVSSVPPRISSLPTSPISSFLYVSDQFFSDNSSQGRVNPNLSPTTTALSIDRGAHSTQHSASTEAHKVNGHFRHYWS